MLESAQEGSMPKFGKIMALGGLAAVGLAWLRRKQPVEPRDDEAWARESAAGTPDPIDEAIAESFPASDPPSYAGSTSSAQREGP